MKSRGFESLQKRRKNVLLQCLLCVLTLISVSVPPRVTAVARGRSRSFCQKCRWQVTAKTHRHLTYVVLYEETWCMVIWCTHNLRRDGYSFMWHQPCQRCKYATLVDIQKTRYKKLATHVEPDVPNMSTRHPRGHEAPHHRRTTYERSESTQESGE